MLYYKKSIYRRKKYLYKKFSLIKEIKLTITFYYFLINHKKILENYIK